RARAISPFSCSACDSPGLASRRSAGNQSGRFASWAAISSATLASRSRRTSTLVSNWRAELVRDMPKSGRAAPPGEGSGGEGGQRLLHEDPGVPPDVAGPHHDLPPAEVGIDGGRLEVVGPELEEVRPGLAGAALE